LVREQLHVFPILTEADGGGVRGMSTIAILKGLMKKLARKRNVAVIPRIRHDWRNQHSELNIFAELTKKAKEQRAGFWP
jgi:hypothetical protein